MWAMLCRVFGVVPVGDVRRIVKEHNRQRAADDAVYKAQSEEIHRLGRLLEERDIRHTLALNLQADLLVMEHAAELRRMQRLIDEANEQRLSENARMQRLVDDANRLRLRERTELMASAGASTRY